MKVITVTAYNPRNGSTSEVHINIDQVTTISYGEEAFPAEGRVLLAMISLSDNSSIYVDVDDMVTILEKEMGIKPKPKAAPKPAPKAKAAPKPKAKAKPKAKK